MDALQASKVIEKTLSGAGAPLTEDQALLLVGALAVCIEKVRAAAQPAPAPSRDRKHPPMCEPQGFFEMLLNLAETEHISPQGISGEAMRAVRNALANAQPAPAAVPAGFKLVPVEGAVWGLYGEDGVCLIQRGTEDDRIAKRGGERLYRLAAAPAPATGGEHE